MPIKIRDPKMTYNTVTNPAVVFDKQCGTLLKIGERDIMMDYCKQIQAQYDSFGFHDMASCIVCMDLPKDQEVVDKVFQITGYVKRLYDDIVANQNPVQ